MSFYKFIFKFRPWEGQTFLCYDNLYIQAKTGAYFNFF